MQCFRAVLKILDSLIKHPIRFLKISQKFKITLLVHYHKSAQVELNIAILPWNYACILKKAEFVGQNYDFFSLILIC